MGIEGVGGGQSQVQQQADVAATMAGSEAEIQKIATEIAPLFAATGNVTVNETRRTEEGEATHATTDAPQLDEAEVDLIMANNVDLEALIAKLQADIDEAQIMAAEERIESMMGEITAQHENTMALVAEAIDSMREQEKLNKLSEVLGWLGVVMAAVMLVATIFTGGAAAIAVAAIALALTLTMQIMNETGTMEDILDALAQSIKESFNCSSEEADAAAQLIIAAIELLIAIASICCGNIGGATSAVSGVSQATKTAIKTAVTVAGLAMSAVNLGASVASAVVNYEAGMAEADVKEAEAVLKKLQELLDQESDDLEQLIKQLNDSLAAVIELLGSKQDALNTISMNIGA